MNRVYLENDSVILKLREDFLLDVQLYSGENYSAVCPRRLFPISGGNKYISLLDREEHEIAVIRNADSLMDESRKALLESLKQYYLIPKILRINEIEEKYGTIHITADTDHGICSFDVTDRTHNLRTLFDGRVLIRDVNDNRYEIPDIRKIDRKTADILLL